MADSDKELYIKYCNNEVEQISTLVEGKSNDEIIKLLTERIQELERIRFEGRARLSIVHSELSKRVGQGKFAEITKGRGTLLDPTWKMPTDHADPRKNTKKSEPSRKEKDANLMKNLLSDIGIDKEALLASIRAKRGK